MNPRAGQTQGGTAIMRMLPKLLDTIFELWRAPQDWARAGFVPADPLADTELSDAERRFRARFIELARHRQQSNGKLLAGLLTLDWQVSRPTPAGPPQGEIKRLAGMVSEVVLEQMADLPDLVLQYDADHFLVCFAGAGEPIAELRLAMMAQALQAALEQRIPDIAGKLRIDAAMSSFAPALPLRRSPSLASGLASMLVAAQRIKALGPLGSLPHLRSSS